MIFTSNNDRTSVTPMIGGLLFMCSASCAQLAAADRDVTVQIETSQTNFFADQDLSFQLNVTAEQAIDGVLSWQLTALHRTLARGDIAANIKPGQNNSLSFRLPIPHVKDGVIQQTILQASLKTAGDAKPVEVLHRALWVFCSNPFSDRQQWLERLDLELYDPAGGTAKIFDDAEIPYQAIRSIAGLRAAEGIVIVGEGVSLGKNTLLAETLVSLAAKGRRVLWFGPADGEFEFPSGETFAGKEPNNLVLSRSDTLEQLDKRLDANLWTDADNAKSIGLQVVARRSKTYVEIVGPDRGWSWLRLDFADPEGTLILSGLRLVDCWDASPTPRFMLARLLEQIADTDSTTAPPTH
jgi:hypothetical protein